MNELHISALDLDLVAMGQATPERLERMTAHCGACRTCAVRRDEHDEHVRRFRMSVFPRTLEKVVARRRSVLPWRWMLGLALPLAAGLLLLALGRDADPGKVLPGVGDPSILGVKGSPVVRVFARRARSGAPEADVIKVKDGDRLRAGDALRFVLSPAGWPYVFIASVDGAGQANVYFPFHGEASVKVDAKGTVSVPDSIVLDEAPGPERIFVIHSKSPVQAETVRAALATVAVGGAPAIRKTLQLPIAGTVQSTLLFEKEDKR
jgi:hypothetical protein